MEKIELVVASDLLDGLQSLGLLRLLVLVLFGPIRFALLPLGKPLLVTCLLVTGFPAAGREKIHYEKM